MTTNNAQIGLTHKAFKEPFPKFEKGESSEKKDNKVSYTYVDDGNVINMLESSNHAKGKAKVESSNVETNSQAPLGVDSSSSLAPQ